METRLTLRPGDKGTRKLLERFGERLLRVRYLYDPASRRRLKTVELIVHAAPWDPRPRKPRRRDEDIVPVRIAWHETDLRERMSITQTAMFGQSREPLSSNVGPARTKADNSVDQRSIARNVWLSVCRFHVGRPDAHFPAFAYLPRCLCCVAGGVHIGQLDGVCERLDVVTSKRHDAAHG